MDGWLGWFHLFTVSLCLLVEKRIFYFSISFNSTVDIYSNKRGIFIYILLAFLWKCGSFRSVWVSKFCRFHILSCVLGLALGLTSCFDLDLETSQSVKVCVFHNSGPGQDLAFRWSWLQDSIHLIIFSCNIPVLISTSSTVTPLRVQIPRGKKLWVKTEDEACRRKWRGVCRRSASWERRTEEWWWTGPFGDIPVSVDTAVPCDKREIEEVNQYSPSSAIYSRCICSPGSSVIDSWRLSTVTTVKTDGRNCHRGFSFDVQCAKCCKPSFLLRC